MSYELYPCARWAATAMHRCHRWVHASSWSISHTAAPAMRGYRTQAYFDTHATMRGAQYTRAHALNLSTLSLPCILFVCHRYGSTDSGTDSSARQRPRERKPRERVAHGSEAWRAAVTAAPLSADTDDDMRRRSQPGEHVVFTTDETARRETASSDESGGAMRATVYDRFDEDEKRENTVEEEEEEEEEEEDDEEEEEEEFFLPDPVDMTVEDGWMTADDKMRARYARRLRKADRQLRFFDLLSPAHIHRYIHISDVCTRHGVRWLDVCARPQLWQKTRRTRFSEGQFTRAALNALFEESPLEDVHIRLMDSGTLPITLLGKDCACLLLRHAHDRNTPAGVTWTTHPYPIWTHAPNDPSPSPPHRTAAAHSARTPKASRHVWPHDDGPAADPHDSATVSPMSASAQRGTVLSDTHPRGRRARRADAQRWPPRRSVAERRPSWWRRLVPDWGGLSRWQKGGARGVRHHRDGAQSARITTLHADSVPHRTKITAGDLTQLLTVFIVRKRPKRCFGGAKGSPAPAMDGVMSEKNGWWEGGNKSRHEQGSMNHSSAAHMSDAAKRDDDEGWTVVTVHPNPLAFVQYVHRHWSDFVAHEADVRGSACDSPRRVHRCANGRCDVRAPDEEEEEEDADARAGRAAQTRATAESDYDATLPTGVEHWLPFHGTVWEWDDVVRVVVHGTVRGLQDAVYHNTFSLEALEVEIFDDASTASSVAQLKRRTQLMARLHVLTRRARLYSSVLREMRVAYVKMKKTMQSATTAMDRKELLNLRSTASLAMQLEDHSHSLLALQFSVAMNHLERHLRTLTIFSTIFIPLEFIASCFSTNFPVILEMEDSNLAVIVATIMLTVAAIVTSRWIKQRDR